MRLHEDDITSNATIMEGKYVIDILENSWEDRWSSLHADLIEFYARHGRTLCRNAQSVGMKITGYTWAHIIDDEGDQTIFYAHPSYCGLPWYDWVYVHFVEKDEEVYYPSKILGFVEGGDGRVEAVVQCSQRPLKWESVEKKMFVPFQLGMTSESFVSVPLSSFVYPLCVIKDYGGGKNTYIVVLPKRQWVISVNSLTQRFRIFRQTYMLLENAVVQVRKIYLILRQWFEVVVHAYHHAFKVKGHAHDIIISVAT